MKDYQVYLEDFARMSLLILSTHESLTMAQIRTHLRENEMPVCLDEHK